MVLQQLDTIPVWGKDQPGQKISIASSWGEEAVAITDEKGNWKTELITPAATEGEHQLTIKGSAEVLLEDILLGEVWFAAGQSNMDMPLRGFSNTPVDNSLETILNSQNDNLRFFKTQRNASLEPLENVRGEWQIASPSTSGNFSAVAYHFAEQVQSQLGVPLGIITSSWGGSKVQAWMSENSLEKFSDVIIPDTLSKEIPVMRQTPTALYNAMVSPYKNYAIKGILWYQGESDRSNENYQTMFSELISSWRNKWNKESLPFYFVQIAPFDYAKNSSVAGPNSALVREAQQQTFLNTPNTGMVVTMDVGDCKDVHPSNKQKVGKRLAYWALADTYKLNIPYQSPIFKSAKLGKKPGEIILYFDHAEMGFNHQNEIEGFSVADEKLEYYPARARVNKDKTISIWNDNLKNPKHIRYGYEDCPTATLKNTFGFPASPFETSL